MVHRGVGGRSTRYGEVLVGPQFRALEAAWIGGVAAMTRAGHRRSWRVIDGTDTVPRWTSRY